VSEAEAAEAAEAGFRLRLRLRLCGGFVLALVLDGEFQALKSLALFVGNLEVGERRAMARLSD
jgi:hypothetical protein